MVSDCEVDAYAKDTAVTFIRSPGQRQSLPNYDHYDKADLDGRRSYETVDGEQLVSDVVCVDDAKVMKTTVVTMVKFIFVMTTTVTATKSTGRAKTAAYWCCRRSGDRRKSHWEIIG